MIPAIRLRYSAHQLVQLRCFAAAVFEVVLLVGLNRAKWERGAAREGGKHAKWERPVLHEGEKNAMWESRVWRNAVKLGLEGITARNGSDS